ncbi:MAG: NAD dependent epimerase/dehydratase family enzyme, partial [Verrucomicrobiales bacterium]
FLPTPKFAVDLRLGKEAANELLFYSARVIPAVLADSGFIFTHPTIDQAFEALL